MTSIETAILWLLTLVSGTFATTIMVLAIAFAAYAMLLGHVSIGRLGQIVLGCFILVGSAEIGGAITDLVPRGDVVLTLPEQYEPRALPEPPPPPPARRGNPFDPYAGRNIAVD